MRDRLGADGVCARAQEALAALRRAFPTPAEEHRSWPRSARLLPHVLAVARHAKATGELAGLLNTAGIYLSSRAQVRPASEVLERARAIFEAA